MINQYLPTSVSPPGLTLLETIETLGISQTELAARMGRPIKTINEIINAKTKITSETAVQLEVVLGVSANFWLSRQIAYDEFLSRAEQVKCFENYISWKNEFPIRAASKIYGWEKKETDIDEVKFLLQFFGVTSPEGWKQHWKEKLDACYRRVEKPVPYESLSLWLRLGEIKAHEISCQDFEPNSFKAILKKIRILTQKPLLDVLHQVEEMCSSAGVAFVLIPELPGTGVFGATRWLSKKKAIIQQSLRLKTNDQFWYTFFHESAHVILHSSKDIIIEQKDGKSKEIEDEANNWAAEFLIPRHEYQEFVEAGQFNSLHINRFSKTIGISPAILVGRLQHDGHIKHNFLNSLKERFEWVYEKHEEN